MRLVIIRSNVFKEMIYGGRTSFYRSEYQKFFISVSLVYCSLSVVDDGNPFDINFRGYKSLYLHKTIDLSSVRFSKINRCKKKNYICIDTLYSVYR